MEGKVAQRNINRDHIIEEKGVGGDFQILETGSNFPFITQGEDSGLAIDRGALLLEQRESQLEHGSTKVGEKGWWERIEEWRLAQGF